MTAARPEVSLGREAPPDRFEPDGRNGDFPSADERARRELQRANPDGSVVTRDLTKIAIPVIDAAWIAANYAPREARTLAQDQILALSEQFIGELLDADEYVMGVPMHNWGPPASFKLWVDHIVTASSGMERPLAGTRVTLVGKRATFIVVAGGVYARGSANASRDFLTPWLRTLFGSLGVREMQFICVDGTKETNNNGADRTAFLAPHRAAIRALFGRD